MLEVTQLSGFGGAGPPPGPYTMSYSGLAQVSGASVSPSFDLGQEYSDRIVFVALIGQGAQSLSISGVSGVKIGGNYSYGASEFWYVPQPSGSGATPVSVVFSSSTTSTVFVYVLGGGGGLIPTTDFASGSANNSNSAMGYFSTAALVNDYVLAAGMKGGSSAFTGFSSNMAPLSYNSGTVSVSSGGIGGGGGVASVGPVTSGIGAGSAYVQAVGGDSSKAIQMCAIKIRKAV